METIKIISAPEAAKLLKSDVRTVERKAKSGYYPKDVCGRHGRYWLFNEEKLIKFIFSS